MSNENSKVIRSLHFQLAKVNEDRGKLRTENEGLKAELAASKDAIQEVIGIHEEAEKEIDGLKATAARLRKNVKALLSGHPSHTAHPEQWKEWWKKEEEARKALADTPQPNGTRRGIINDSL